MRFRCVAIKIELDIGEFEMPRIVIQKCHLDQDKLDIAASHGAVVLLFGDNFKVGDLNLGYAIRGMFWLTEKVAENKWRLVARRKDFAALCRSAVRTSNQTA